MHGHGVDPGIDFSDLARVRRTVEQCNGIGVHPRHPYGGDLVFTAFSGSHQDAIKKGFDALAPAGPRGRADPSELPWRVPYLPVDPADVGRTYEAVVRINSQSGKNGVAYVLGAWHHLNTCRATCGSTSPARCSGYTDAEGGEISPAADRRPVLPHLHLVAARPAGVRARPGLGGAAPGRGRVRHERRPVRPGRGDARGTVRPGRGGADRRVDRRRGRHTRAGSPSTRTARWANTRPRGAGVELDAADATAALRAVSAAVGLVGGVCWGTAFTPRPRQANLVEHR